MSNILRSSTRLGGLLGLTLALASLSQPALSNHNGGGCNTINGTAFQDNLDGTSGCDDIFGGGGQDLIRGFAGNDDVHGESGYDQVYGGGDFDEVRGGGGSDDLSGSDGNDSIEDVAIDNDVDRACGNAGTDYIDLRDSDTYDKYWNGTEVTNADWADEDKGGASCPF